MLIRAVNWDSRVQAGLASPNPLQRTREICHIPCDMRFLLSNEFGLANPALMLIDALC